jgi:hypothetical protein
MHYELGRNLLLFSKMPVEALGDGKSGARVFTHCGGEKIIQSTAQDAVENPVHVVEPHVNRFDIS